MDNEERRKVKELMKEKSDTPLQWMYKESKPDDEDFLLGKKIGSLDKSEMEKKQDNYEQILGERIQANIALDVKAKIREDPLFAIRHKEKEAKKRLLENPVKMKRLQNALARKEAEKKKKSKKKHKHRNSDSDGGEDDIMTKYLAILNEKRKGGNSASHKQHSSPDVSRSPSREREGKRKQEEKYRNYQGRDMNRKDKYSGSEDDRLGYKRRHNEDNDKYKGRNRDQDQDTCRNRRKRYSDSGEEMGRVSDRYKYNRDGGASAHGRDRNTDRYYGSDNQRNRSNDKNQSNETRRRVKRYSDSESDKDRRPKQRQNYSDDRSRSDYRSSKRKERNSNSEDEVKQRRLKDSDIGRSRSNNQRDKYDRKYEENSSEYRNSRRVEHDSETDTKYFSKHKNAGNIIQRRRQQSESSSDSSSSDSDTRTKTSSKHTKKSHRHSSTSSSESDRHRADRSKLKEEVRTNLKAIKNGKRKDSSSSGTDSDSSSPKRKSAPKGYGLIKVPTRDGRSPPDDRQTGHKESRSKMARSPSPKRRDTKKRQKSRSPQQPKRKLTDEEKQQRLEEMMDNAKWREDQRNKNIRKYATEDQREVDDQVKNYETTGSSEFVNPMLSLHADSSSVEDRIKRNRHNILRTTADMDRGFSKK